MGAAMTVSAASAGSSGAIRMSSGRRDQRQKSGERHLIRAARFPPSGSDEVGFSPPPTDVGGIAADLVFLFKTTCKDASRTAVGAARTQADSHFHDQSPASICD